MTSNQEVAGCFKLSPHVALDKSALLNEYIIIMLRERVNYMDVFTVERSRVNNGRPEDNTFSVCSSRMACMCVVLHDLSHSDSQQPSEKLFNIREALLMISKTGGFVSWREKRSETEGGGLRQRDDRTFTGQGCLASLSDCTQVCSTE